MEFQAAILEISRTLQRIKLFPYFDVANYILMCIIVKEDTPQKGDPTFSRRHPFACWLATMMMCFAAPIISSALAGETVLASFANHRDILLATAVWYAINYLPFDIGYRLSKLKPVYTAVCLLKELQRARKVQYGVAAAMRHQPSAHLLIVLAGVVKGSGYLEMKIFERLIRGVWLPASSEILQPSATTKACTLASVLFLLQGLGRLPAPYSKFVFIGTVAAFTLIKLTYLLFGLRDPFAPFENLFCALFLGGLADALRRASGAGGVASPAAVVNGSAATGKAAPQMSATGSSASMDSDKNREEKKND